MKVTKPEEMASDLSQLEDAINEFEALLKREIKGQDYYHIVLAKELNKETCIEIASIYRKAGWPKVFCKTSSENGERPGLTGLELYKNI